MYIFRRCYSCSWKAFRSFDDGQVVPEELCNSILGCLGLFGPAGMVDGVSRPRSQLLIKVIIAVTLTSLCMLILHQYDSAGTVDKVKLSVVPISLLILLFTFTCLKSCGKSVFSGMKLFAVNDFLLNDPF